MGQPTVQQTLDTLIILLKEKKQEYKECVERNDVREVKKKIRLHIRDLEDQINILKQMVVTRHLT